VPHKALSLVTIMDSYTEFCNLTVISIDLVKAIVVPNIYIHISIDTWEWLLDNLVKAIIDLFRLDCGGKRQIRLYLVSKFIGKI